MAQKKLYRVTLRPSELKGKTIITRWTYGEDYPTKEFEARGVQAALDQVCIFANEYGKGCRASVRCLSGRKPPGFDKVMRELYFNLEKSKQAELADDQDSV